MLFSTVTKGFPIRANGTFTVKQTTTYEGRTEILVKGPFSGRKVRRTPTIHQRWIKLDCRGNRAFTAKRQS